MIENEHTVTFYWK